MSAVAMKVRQEKAFRPELFCSVPGCLWRTVTRMGASPCRKHPRPATPPTGHAVVVGGVRFTITRVTDPGVLARTCFAEIYSVVEDGADHRHAVVQHRDGGHECLGHAETCPAVEAVLLIKLQYAFTPRG